MTGNKELSEEHFQLKIIKLKKIFDIYIDRFGT